MSSPLDARIAHPVRETVDYPAWPTHGLIDDVRLLVGAVLEERRACVIATLVKAEGPSPRPVGAQMAIASPTEFAGYVSGGCVEPILALEAQGVLDTGQPRRLVLGRGSPILDVRLTCGGRIELALERVTPGQAPVRRWLDAGGRRQAATWLCCLVTGRQACVIGDPGEDLPPTLAKALHASRASGSRAGLNPDGQAFWRKSTPCTRLVVIGGDPIALGLCAVAESAGFEVILDRPMGPAEPPPGFTGRYLRGPADIALDAVGLDPWTAVVTTTHETDTDHEVLVRALPGSGAYVGVLGSRSRVEERRARLLAAGLSPETISRLRAPVGLDIGATTPLEIAVAIVADIIARQGGRGSP